MVITVLADPVAGVTIGSWYNLMLTVMETMFCNALTFNLSMSKWHFKGCQYM